ncbi:RNA polymerase sigma factor [Nocardia salmonicida]|uniref:RNA polymerase sigma factor n=1 Tax=Nocardia salmonicida TaxID=53431 RepID=UPI003CF4C539
MRLLLCCHPSLSRPSQVALTLHAVAGLSTAQIAAAYLVPERTMTQRLTRARATLRAAGAVFELPAQADLPARIAAVLDVCHLLFAEGHTRSAGGTLVDRTMADEAIRLTRQLQAAIAAVHAESPTWASTDWRQISILYAMLDRIAPGPIVTLNRAVAVGTAFDPRDVLALMDPLLDDPLMVRRHRTHAVRAHLLELIGDRPAARESYRRAAQLTAGIPEQRYLNTRLRHLTDDD